MDGGGDVRMKSAIVVVDPQYGWYNPHTAPMFTKLANELSHFGRWSDTLIATFANAPESVFRRLLPWWSAFQSSEDRAVLPAFDRREVLVFPRTTYGLSSALWDHLRHQAIEQVVLTGVETDATIAMTAMEAFDRGYSVVVPRHLVASTYGPPGQEHGIAIIRKVLGHDHVLSQAQTRIMFSRWSQS